LTLLLALAVALPLALAHTTFLVAPTANGLWRGIADPPGALRLGLSLLAGGLVAIRSRSLPPSARRPLLIGLLSAAPFVPVFTGHFLGLLAFTPPLVRILLCGALFASLHAVAPPSLPRPAFWAAAAFLFYLLVGSALPGPAGPQGDEPHYLTMAESLRSDGDLDLRDELETRAYAPFYTGTLAPHTSPASPEGREYPVHTPGLPVLLLPAYALGGYPGTRVFMSALAALGVWLVHRLARDCVSSPALATLALALTPPFAFYAVSLYPELPVALVTALLLIASRPGVRTPWLAGAAAAAAFVPWLHPKYLPLAALGLLFATWRLSPWRRIASWLPLVLSVAALLLFMRAHYGRASISAAYGGGFRDDVTLGRALHGAPALLFDRQFGLFTVAPLFLLALPGAALLGRRAPQETLRALGLCAAAFGVNACFSMWWGGTCPPARFLVPCLPALALFVGEAAAVSGTLSAALIGVGLGVVSVAAEAPRALHNRADGESALLRVLARGLDLDRLLPSFVVPDEAALLLALSLLAVFALGWWRGWRGLAVGALAYGALVTSVHPGHALDAREAALALIEGYDDRAVIALSGPWRPEAMSVTFDLPGAPWELSPDEVRRSRRLDLTPGRYRLDVDGRILDARRTAHVVRLDVLADDTRLARLYLEEGKPLPTALLDLGEDSRRLLIEATGIQGQGRIDAVRMVPLALVPRRDRVR
jgi:hypothetical protein